MKTSHTMVSAGTFGNAEIKLTIEGEQAPFWGRVEYEDNLIVEEADSIATLQDKMQTLLLKFHELDPNSYELKIESA